MNYITTNHRGGLGNAMFKLAAAVSLAMDNNVEYIYKNEWFYSTSKSVDKLNNLDVINTNVGFGRMILETFDNKKENINLFQDIMNKEYNYNYILVNYNNKFIHDYTDVLGLSYTKLIFTDCKNQETQLQEIISNIMTKNINYDDSIFSADNVKDRLNNINKLNIYCNN